MSSIYDNNGNKIGEMDNDGNVRDNSGRKIGRVNTGRGKYGGFDTYDDMIAYRASHMDSSTSSSRTFSGSVRDLGWGILPFAFACIYITSMFLYYWATGTTIDGETVDLISAIVMIVILVAIPAILICLYPDMWAVIMGIGIVLYIIFSVGIDPLFWVVVALIAVSIVTTFLQTR